jgi:hypothetical protein
MTNTFCPLNPELDEEIHMNSAMGTWPIAAPGQFTGELIISNWRWCRCEGYDLMAAKDAVQVFYPDTARL